MSVESVPSTATTLFQPTWGRGLIALVLAVTGFLLPQEVPLVWYPLNEPGDDILYLELTCASDKPGEVQIFHNLTQGINQLDSIIIPISPTEQTYTYTFPLPDAPITELRIDPVNAGGTLTIRQMRIIDRRNTEIRRFTADMFRSEHEIAAITPIADGWKITTTPNAVDPYTRIELFSPIQAKGINHRNFLRCLLSWSYLALMLWILLLAVLFTFYRPPSWHGLAVHASFMASLALLFSFVGNRGLIKNSLHYAGYHAPTLAPGLNLEFDVESSAPSPTQLFFDTGNGINELDSIRRGLADVTGLQTVRFPLPLHFLKAIRYDPRDNLGSVRVRGIRVIDAGQRTRAIIPLTSLIPTRQVAVTLSNDGSLLLATPPPANDPALTLDAAALTFLNQVIGTENSKTQP